MDMTRKHILSFALMTALGMTVTSTAFAQLHLEIAKAPEQAPKIAIVPFGNDQSIFPIVENDLNRSGRFSSASKNLPTTASIDAIQASAWQAAGIPYVVVGNLKPAANNAFEVHYQLYDVQKQQYLLNEVLTVPASRACATGSAYD